MCPYGEVSLRRSVLTVKCPYGEVFERRSARMTNCPTGKCPTTKNPTAKSPEALMHLGSFCFFLCFIFINKISYWVSESLKFCSCIFDNKHHRRNVRLKHSSRSLLCTLPSPLISFHFRYFCTDKQDTNHEKNCICHLQSFNTRGTKV